MLPSGESSTVSIGYIDGTDSQTDRRQTVMYYAYRYGRGQRGEVDDDDDDDDN